MILAIKTDSPVVYLGVYIADGSELENIYLQVGRELSNQLLSVMQDLCDLSKITGIVIFEGPGSYTGLRIGFSVANAIGYSNQIPVISSGSDQWLQSGLKNIARQIGFQPVTPAYGGVVHTTTPRK